MPFIVFFFAVVLPVVVWLWFIRREDASEPEPGRLMRRCFYVGITAGLGAGFFEFVLFKLLGLPSSVFAMGHQTPLILTTTAVLLVGPIEELAKYIVLRANVYYSHDFNQVFDGIVYGITVALGFSFVENISYFIDLYTTQTTAMFVVGAMFRGLFTTLAHVTFTGVLGYYVGKAKFSATGRFSLILQGVLYASVLHSFYDFLAISPIPFGGLWAALLVCCSFLIFVRIWKRPDVRMVWQYVPPPAVPPTPVS